MKVNMDDLLLAGLLDNDDELILLSQVCSGSDVPSFEKGFDLDIYGHMYVDSPLVRYTSAARAKRFGNASWNSTCSEYFELVINDEVWG